MQTYYAKSMFSSTTIWVNVATFVIAVTELTEVVDLVPQAWHGEMLALAAVINVALRIFTVRPVAAIAPGNVEPVRVKSIEATPPKS